MPGVDVNGVGTNQPRPFIRGQRGQRVLLLEDGIRMNNPRRELDFGELAAIAVVEDNPFPTPDDIPPAGTGTQHHRLLPARLLIDFRS